MIFSSVAAWASWEGLLMQSRCTFPRRPQQGWASCSEEETEEGDKMENWDACVFGVGVSLECG
jgi:hypothetical protein